MVKKKNGPRNHYFKEPKVLPCCHTFCKGCLSKLPVMKKPESELSEDLSVNRDDTVSLECSIVHYLDHQDSEYSWNSGEIEEESSEELSIQCII